MATKDKIFELWAKRDPEWETQYQELIMDQFCDYGKGSSSYQHTRGKLFGAGYELFIVAFFIGLYYNKSKNLIPDKAKRKHFGHAIENWGNGESRGGRKQYSHIRQYMFMALVARTDVDWIALDKGELTPRKAVDQLMDKMEQYANFGFDFIKDKLEENPTHFFKETAFLQLFLDVILPTDSPSSSDEEPESLD